MDPIKQKSAVEKVHGVVWLCMCQTISFSLSVTDSKNCHLICQNYLSPPHICTSKGKEELGAPLPLLPILLSQQHLLLTQKNVPLILVAPIWRL